MIGTGTHPWPRRSARWTPWLVCIWAAVLLLAATARAQDLLEPNDDFATATPIELQNGAGDRPGCIEPAGDVDFFRFSVPDRAVVLATTPPLEPGGMFELTLFDAAQQVVAVGSGSVLLPDAPGGEYFLRVSAAATGCYQVFVSAGLPIPPSPPPPVPPPSDAFEPNDDFASATPLRLPAMQSACIDPSTDVDFFSFAVPGEAHLLVTAFAGRDPVQTTLFDARQRLVASGITSIELPAASEGQYFLRVSADRAICPYELSIVASVTPLDPFEPNNDLASATRLVLRPDPANRFSSASVEAALSLGDLDFYAFTASAGTLSVTRAVEDPFLPLFVLMDGTGHRLDQASVNPSVSQSVVFRLSTNGAYIIGVTTSDDLGLRGATTAGTYRLLFTLRPPQPRVVVPGHTVELIGTGLPEALGAGVASDPENGEVYALQRGAQWGLVRFTEGRIEDLSVSAPPEAGPGSDLTDLEFRRGFGGSDLFTADQSGRTIAFGASGGTGRLFADTRGGDGAGLAFSDRLFVSSGLFGFPDWAPPTIYAVGRDGTVSTYMGPEQLSAPPSTLAFSPDRKTLYYSDFIGRIVAVDVASARETDSVLVGGPAAGLNCASCPPPNFVVDAVTGDLYIVPVPGVSIGQFGVVRYVRATGHFQGFADRVDRPNDLAFGACDPQGNEWCLYVTYGFGLLKIRGFERPLELRFVADALTDVVAANAGTPLADKIEDVLAAVNDALGLLEAGDRQGALGEMKGAIGELEGTVKDGLLAAAEGTAFMERIAGAARRLADEAIEEAEDRGGDAGRIGAAKQAFADGDAHRAAGEFKDALAGYKDAVAQAVHAIRALKETILATGSFTGRAGHTGQGQVSLVRLHSGEVELRFDADFAVSSVPGPVVVLSTRDSLGRSIDPSLGDLEIGALQSAAGAQRYVVPGGDGGRRFVWVFDKPFLVEVARAALTDAP